MEDNGNALIAIAFVFLKLFLIRLFMFIPLKILKKFVKVTLKVWKEIVLMEVIMLCPTVVPLLFAHVSPFYYFGC